MPTLRAVAAVLLALAAVGPQDAHAAISDSTDTVSADPLAWARAVVQARRAIEAAEAEPDPVRKAALATDAVRAVDALQTDRAAEASFRSLALRAQAAVEAAVGPVAPEPLAPHEWGALRGPALAALGPDFAPPLVDPAAVAARQAEAERAVGPVALFYPVGAVEHVEAQRAAAARLARAGRRGHRTLGRIERVLRRRGLPVELQYVAVIESALNPQAESGAGAEGLWQFMPATAEEFGLDSLTVHQEGPSTEAAARYLRWLGGRFDGDWHLALAAYNCGVGRVEGIVREVRAEIGRPPTFWDVRERLPRETQHYVPRFLAVAEALGARS